jgi:16S rRNA (guanine(527)-N(7))-methyltransferase RsmG
VRAPEQTPVWFRDVLNRELLRWVRLSDVQIAQLYQHYELLVRWNERMNLTSVKPGPEMVVRHYCESLFFAAHLPEQLKDVAILDVGSGAGFPGVPLAILKPAWHVVLVEAVQKKAVFLRESCRHLQNVSVLAQRIENVTQSGDWAVSRAVEPREILRNLPRLAKRVGLMLGEEDFSLLRRSTDSSLLRRTTDSSLLRDTTDSSLLRDTTDPALLRDTTDFSLRRDTKVIAWSQPVRLPWGDRKVCVYGDVPRETHK